jgi:hypothetical protein
MMPKDHVFLGVSVANLGLGSAVSWMTIQMCFSTATWLGISDSLHMGVFGATPRKLLSPEKAAEKNNKPSK